MTKANTTDIKMSWNRDSFRKFNSKFHNSKVYIAGKKVADSKHELKRKGELELLLKAGKISDIDYQKKFELQPHFQLKDGTWIKSINYYADFYYFDKEKNVWVVEDAKGFVTDVYKVKKKMFLYKFPQYEFRETYADKQKTLGGLEGEEDNIFE